MIPKILTGVALAFAVIGLIIKLVSVSVPHFVDVHLIADIDDLSDDNVIAGVGVYQSIFDPTGDELRDIAAAEGLPIEVIESDTPDFPLLFPSQTNFQAQLLPIGQDAAAELDALVGAGGGLVAAFGPIIDSIESLEFSDCESYGQAAVALNIEYFQLIEDNVLPGAVSTITALIALGLNNGTEETGGFNDLSAGISAAASAGGSVGFGAVTLAFVTAGGLNPSLCAAILVNGAIDPTREIDDDVRTCLNTGISAINTAEGAGKPRTIELLNYFNAVITAEFANGAILLASIGAVVQSLEFDPASGGGAMGASPDFIVEFASNPVCGVVSPAFNCQAKVEYLGLLRELLIETFKVDVVGDPTNDLVGGALTAVSGYLALFGEGSLVTPASTFNDAIIAVGVDAANSVIPPLFNDTYAPCGILNVFDAVQPDANIFGEADTCNTFETFLPGVLAVLILDENELAPLVASIVGIYESCLEFGGFTGQLNEIADVCVESVFAPGLLGAIPGAELLPDFQTNFVEACEDDEEDRAAVETAQVLVGLSATLNVITVIVIIVSFFVLPHIIGPVAAGISILAGIFLIAGLLIVRGAPVYEGVGEEPNGEDLEAIFVEGYVAVLALVDALLSFFAAGLLIAAAITSCFCGEESEEGDYDEDKEKVQNVEDQL